MSKFNPTFANEQEENAFLNWLRWSEHEIVAFDIYYRRLTVGYEESTDKKEYLDFLVRGLFNMIHNSASSNRGFNLLNEIELRARAKFLQHKGIGTNLLRRLSESNGKAP